MIPFEAYRVTPPNGKSYNVVVADNDGAVALFSDATGKFLSEYGLHIADLLMPEQELNEWDVRQLPSDEAKALFAKVPK